MKFLYSNRNKLQNQLAITTLELNDYKHQEQKMLGNLAKAGQEICKLNHEVGRLREENKKLWNGEYAINYAPQIGAFKERVQQLEWELEMFRCGTKANIPNEVIEALIKIFTKQHDGTPS